MGPIPGLDTITTALLCTMVVSTVVVLGLSVAFVVPALRVNRTDRLRRSLNIPTYYLHPAATH
ncbi:MAG: hypothetical protein ACJ715_06100 [Ornithinibacter sp.]